MCFCKLGWWAKELGLRAPSTQRCGEGKEVIMGAQRRYAPMQLFRFGPHTEESVDAPSVP